MEKLSQLSDKSKIQIEEFKKELMLEDKYNIKSLKKIRMLEDVNRDIKIVQGGY